MQKVSKERLRWILWFRWVNECGASLRQIAELMNREGPKFRWGQRRRIKWSARGVLNWINRGKRFYWPMEGERIDVSALPVPTHFDSLFVDWRGLRLPLAPSRWPDGFLRAVIQEEYRRILDRNFAEFQKNTPGGNPPGVG